MFDDFFKKNKAACISGLITFLLLVTVFILRSLVASEIANVHAVRHELQNTINAVSGQQETMALKQKEIDQLNDDIIIKALDIISLTDEIQDMK